MQIINKPNKYKLERFEKSSKKDLDIMLDLFVSELDKYNLDYLKSSNPTLDVSNKEELKKHYSSLISKQFNTLTLFNDYTRNLGYQKIIDIKSGTIVGQGGFIVRGINGEGKVDQLEGALFVAKSYLDKKNLTGNKRLGAKFGKLFLENLEQNLDQVDHKANLQVFINSSNKRSLKFTNKHGIVKDKYLNDPSSFTAGFYHYNRPISSIVKNLPKIKQSLEKDIVFGFPKL